MPTVNIHRATSHLSRLVERAVAGEEIVIARSGKPLVKLVPLTQAPTPRPWGTMADDFNDPLPPEILARFYGGD